jgi:hypothetical protein
MCFGNCDGYYIRRGENVLKEEGKGSMGEVTPSQVPLLVDIETYAYLMFYQ